MTSPQIRFADEVAEVDEVFDRLRACVRELEAAISVHQQAEQAVSERILAERTSRIAREPLRVEHAVESLTCMVFQRCARSYAVPLQALSDVGPIASIAHVPGIPEPFLGVTARRGRVVSVVDVPRLFGTSTVEAPLPKWLVMTSSSMVVCGVGADELHDIIDVNPASMAKAMPTFPTLIQRYTLGVLEDRTVILDIVGLLEDRVLRVEERGT
jgi:chemotaxis signal transduction protein